MTLNSGFSTSGTTGLLATLSGATAPALSATPATFSYTTTPIPLAANTTYWLQVDTFGSGTTNTEIGWAATNNIGTIDAGGLPGWTYYDGSGLGYTLYFTNNGGTGWSSSGFSGVNFPQYSVQFQAVPEPSSYAVLVGLSVLGFAAHRRRRAH